MPGAALDLFAMEQHEWGTTEIAEALALPKSSAHALLASLTEIGLLERTPDRRFRLGHKLLGFGETVLAGSEVFNAIRDMLNELIQRLGRSVNLAVRDSQRVVYINRMQGPSSVPASLGSAEPTLPMHECRREDPAHTRARGANEADSGWPQARTVDPKNHYQRGRSGRRTESGAAAGIRVE
jgi:predicted transcriptional regulator